MEWWVFLAAFLGALLVLLVLRVPIAFSLLAVGMVASWWRFGGDASLNQIAISAFNSVSSFSFVPIPLFILMGEVLFLSNVASRALDVLERQLRQVPGRLAVLSTAGGALFGLLSGSTLANTALFGSTILPDMERAGYSKRLGAGSILASGGLAMVIPPSAIAVLWGAVAQVPVGPLLIAGIIPGAVMALGYLLVIFFWSLVLRGAPRHESSVSTSLTTHVRDIVKFVLPLGTLIFLVLGLIFFGVATPTESAATGALGAIALVVFYREASWGVLKGAFLKTVQTSVMIFMILVGSALYSQLLSVTGATSGLVSAMTGLAIGTIGTLIMMQLCVLVLGSFLDQVSIILITLPLFMPVVAAEGWNPIWFGILMLINLQIAGTTPPFGLNLFVMKGVAPQLSMRDTYTAAMPFIASDIAVMALLIAFPGIVLFLPGLMS